MQAEELEHAAVPLGSKEGYRPSGDREEERLVKELWSNGQEGELSDGEFEP